MISAQHSLTPSGDGRLAGLAARWTRRLSDRIIAVSRPVEEYLINADLVPPERVVVIENGIDTTRFGANEKGAARRALGLAPDALVVGAVGRMTPVKGFDLLLDSIAQLHAKGLEVELLLAGDGPERGSLEDRARTLGIDSQVRFLGVRRDIDEVYAALDIFVLSSLSEASPNALLEAMASGCTVVASAVGGVPDIIAHERSGLLVEAGSSAALVGALERLVTEPSLPQRLGAGARRRAHRDFDIARMVERHRQLYQEILASRQKS